MKSPLLLTLVLNLFCLTTQSQEVCENKTEIDPNSITKCSLKDVEETLNTIEKKQIRTRIVRKKVISGTSLNSHGLNAISTTTANSTAESETSSVDEVIEATDKVAQLKKIPFFLVDQIPLFDKCVDEPLIKQTECFEKYMTKHIANNFNYPKEALLKKIEGKILVQFTIDKDGHVIDIKKKGQENTEILEEEAERLISKLPLFVPGSHNGEKVLVKYALPIIFKLPKSI